MKKATVITIMLFTLGLALPVMAAEDGAALFKSKCGVCHGKTGAADTPIAKAKGIKDLGSADIQKMTDEELTTMIAAGGAKQVKGHDFKNKGLNDEQIKALVTFIRTLKK
ncbi:MAG TPA: cytochrome c [Thermoanaerobaculia bacterium]|nr:cytochrome c [Thermoanaerobaculia bacterium]